jgi:nucleotide-binding universal stress UspA family protein
LYEKILVPLDGSRVGEAALGDVEELALKMMPETPVEVTLLQVVTPMTYDFLTEDQDAQLPYNDLDLKKIERYAQQYLDRVAARLRSRGINVKTVVAEGHEAEEIIKAAQNTSGISRYVHSRPFVGKMAFGSITDKVLHESDVPVLTVWAKAEKSGKRISRQFQKLLTLAYGIQFGRTK